MKNSEVMSASLEGYSFDPSRKPLQLDQEKRKWLLCGARQMKNSEVMPASLEGYSFDPEPQATAAGSRKAEVAALRRQANEELGGDVCITGGLFI
ncbi:hypothetical protein [Bacillus sp. 2205SS5-2]|uniref:hypothetical protein n=1 Tax=Bacillus sp. 2205SS5-2 TaxID=3109031 RepID=UPI0030047294